MKNITPSNTESDEDRDRSVDCCIEMCGSACQLPCHSKMLFTSKSSLIWSHFFKNSKEHPVHHSRILSFLSSNNLRVHPFHNVHLTWSLVWRNAVSSFHDSFC